MAKSTSRDKLMNFSAQVYKNIIKPVLFQFNPEVIHEQMTTIGELLGSSALASQVIASLYSHKDSILSQTVNGVTFHSPIGLSAGFDYDARLTQITPALGFGFHTVGTITKNPYRGNASPILGRLPKSRSLMVNKGFKNKGIEQITQNLEKLKFTIPIGVSIGRTNTTLLKNHAECISDITASFAIIEHSAVAHSYYELNISCPNLLTKISFYEPDKLSSLLQSLDVLHLSKPLYIKMPIECDNTDILNMLSVIAKHNVQGVIFGNLQKNRNDPSLDPEEVRQFQSGNFSGKPTQQRSDELITLTYKNYKTRFTIIGTGGVFNAQDAYTKIKLGASLVQLITGMIYNGPQLISQINNDLVQLLKNDGYSTVTQAIGVESK